MDAEEIAGKCSMKDLRPIAKKYGVKTHCVKKIDVVRALPPEALIGARARWRASNAHLISLRARTTMKRARRRYPKTLSNITAYFQTPTGVRPTGVLPVREMALKYRHSQKEGDVSLGAKVKSRVLLFRAFMVIFGGEDFAIPSKIR